MSKDYYRLPNGKNVEMSGEEYCDAWHTLAAPIEKATNSKLVGFNPGLAFQRNDEWSYTWWEVPADIAILLAAALTSK